MKVIGIFQHFGIFVFPLRAQRVTQKALNVNSIFYIIPWSFQTVWRKKTKLWKRNNQWLETTSRCQVATNMNSQKLLFLLTFRYSACALGLCSWAFAFSSSCCIRFTETEWYPLLSIWTDREKSWKQGV